MDAFFRASPRLLGLLLPLLAPAGLEAAATSTRTATLAGTAIDASAPAAPATLSILDPSEVRYDLDLEYRIQWLNQKPLSLNDLTASDVSFFEQRLRLGFSGSVGSTVKVTAIADVLDGVLFGDNGSFIGSPRTNYGLRLASKSPNLGTFSVGRLDPEGSSVDRENYGLVLVPADALNVRVAYGDVILPFGLLRAGRQPTAVGRTVLTHDGSRINRWGVSRNIDSTDGVTVGTKLSALFDLAEGRPIDRSQDRGWFLAGLWGQVVEDDPAADDDLLQLAAITFYKDHDTRILGVPVDRLFTGLIFSHRYGDLFESRLYGFTAFFELENEYLRFVAHHATLFGSTREVSEGLSLLSEGQPVTAQKILGYGGFAEVAAKWKPFEFSFEVYWASGDDNPETTTDLTQQTVAQDTNVGLHLFENVLNYASARAAAIGAVNLSALGVQSFPVDQIWTRGGLQNAVVLFPQILADPLPWLHLRGGVMFAFTQTRAVDPIGSLLNADGTEIEDDLINFNGGPPGTYWGTEFDFGVTLTPGYGFLFDWEIAYLLPGDALADANGDAVNSFYSAVRLTYVIE